MAEAYSDFAQVYDEFMDDAPYEQWCDTIARFIEQYGIFRPVRGEQDLLASERNLVLDLGCGTGTLTELLYGKGYDMVGVDNAPAMLDIAMKKRQESGSEILYLLQDMREFELYSTVGTVISVCDSLNYILEEDELLGVFRLVNNYLYPGGMFLFDFNTDYKYREVIGDTTIAENREDCSFIWENCYDEESCLNEYDVTIFVRDWESDQRQKEDQERKPDQEQKADQERKPDQEQKADQRRRADRELFRRFTETHVQRGYTVEQMKSLVEQAGMEIIKVLDAESLAEAHACSERIYILARECQKKRLEQAQSDGTAR